jgi:hypothetical protein
MTWCRNESKRTRAGVAVPSRRWRTTVRESSAGKSKIGPPPRTWNWRKKAGQEALLTATSKITDFLQCLGFVPTLSPALVNQGPFPGPK